MTKVFTAKLHKPVDEKTTKGGTAFLQWSSPQEYYDAIQKETVTEWITVKCFNERKFNGLRRLGKGAVVQCVADRVGVWVDNDGNPRKTMTVFDPKIIAWGNSEEMAPPIEDDDIPF